MRIYTVITIVLLSILPGFAEYYEFTDAQGRTITAKPIRMVGTQVEIERDDGSKFTVSPTIFVTKDQEYLAKWAKEQLFVSGDVLKITAKSSTTRKQKDDSSRGVEIKRFKGFYKVKVVNESDMDLTDLDVKYRYYVFKNDIAADKRSSGQTIKVTGQSKISTLPKRSDFEFETKHSEMMETDLESGYRWAGGGKPKSEDELEGIWVRVYQGKNLITEFANPSSLPKKEKW
ncbi:hypothetical protein [Rubellicoccus peritrichatus]|uniref:Uncharacterized protein n=1 Tax=Rubellicoccus peritrichatus TaxID=3080537 RepID=A0AAQ3LG60_9BACT|nr:hypothetical protein [Puniceicoccus sp. CR14]WOO41539.1 hypothetical protein RZN69_00460 [Puniceicoccus sp. CR14]